VDSGEFVITVVCPGCRQEADIPSGIEGVLKRRESGEGSLGLTLSHKAVSHDCDTRQLTIDVETGEVVQ
jgi:hypothetical protein